MNDKIRKAMKDNCIVSVEEAEAAIEFVRELLEINSEEMEEKEPHATNSIRATKEAAWLVSELTEEFTD